jgi:hypothetical protein
MVGCSVQSQKTAQLFYQRTDPVSPGLRDYILIPTEAPLTRSRHELVSYALFRASSCLSDFLDFTNILILLGNFIEVRIPLTAYSLESPDSFLIKKGPAKRYFGETLSTRF